VSDDLADRLESETTLSPQQARVVAHRVDGLTWSEIAEEMNIERGTAKSYHERAKEKAREAQRDAEVFREVGLLDGENTTPQT